MFQWLAFVLVSILVSSSAASSLTRQDDDVDGLFAEINELDIVSYRSRKDTVKNDIDDDRSRKLLLSKKTSTLEDVHANRMHEFSLLMSAYSKNGKLGKTERSLIDNPMHHAWRPPQSWYDQQNWVSTFPTCEAEHVEWCDSSYSTEETEQVQREIHRHQNPSNCSDARFLVVAKEWKAGLGSALHMHAFLLSLALSDDRVLVIDPDLGWDFAPQGMCSCDKIEEPKTCLPHSILSNKDCFFMPTSHCMPPDSWKDAPSFQSDRTSRVVQVDDIKSLQEVSDGSFCRLSAPANPELALQRYSSKHSIWWTAQLVKYITRPRPWVLRDIVVPRQISAFPDTRGRPPHPFAAMFIRSGDKHTEVKPQPIQAYFDELAPVAKKLGIRHVYVSSDDSEVIEFVSGNYSRQYDIHYVHEDRPPGGLSMENVVEWANTKKMERVVQHALADLFITAQADVHVGTLSSNWCRIHDELRRTNGRGRLPYVTPERKLYYGACGVQ